MALTERLALVVSGDTRGAVKGLTDVGRAADKNLGSAENRVDKFGRGLTKVGLGMAAFGAAALVGLGKAAMASEEANLSTVKLQNSLANNPRLAGETSEAYTDLATAIQGKTAADADDITAGIAVLAQGKLNANQLKELTPLVVDLARKKGIDEVAAFTLASKAAAGNAGALKRAGIAVDETAFKTDAYTATVEALRVSVGGFAEMEGKTLAGSLERLRNQMGDLVESVGSGAVEVFTGWADGLGGVVDNLNKVDPAITKGIGKFGAYAATTSLVVGGLSAVSGWLITMRTNLTNAEGGLTRMGKAAVGVGVIGTTLGLIQFGRELSETTVDMDKLTLALGDNADAVSESTRNEIGALIAMGEFGAVLRKTADESVPAARRLLEVANGFEVSADKTAEWKKIIDDKHGSDVQAAQDQKTYADEIAGATGEIEAQEDALKNLADAMKAQFDPQFALLDALQKNADAQAKVTAAQTDGKTTAIELAELQRDVGRSALDVNAAALMLAEGMRAGNVSMGETIDTLKLWVEQGLITAGQGQILAAQLNNVRDKADALNGKNVNVTVTGDASDAIAALDAIRDVFRGLVSEMAGQGIPLSRALVMQSNLEMHDSGGTVGGRRGAPRLIVAHGGEEVLATHRMSLGAALANNGIGVAGGGGTTIVEVKIGEQVLERILIEANARVKRIYGPPG